MAQRLNATGRQDLHRQATLEILGIETMDLCAFGMNQLINESEIFLAGKRAVDIRLVPLLITRFEIGFFKVDGILFHNGRGGIEKG